jgi:hypothetical protein
MGKVKEFFKWLKAELRFRLTKKKWKVDFSPEFSHDFEELSEEEKEEVLQAIEEIRKNPYKGTREL